MNEIPKDKLTGALRRGSVKKNVAAIHVSGKLTLLQRKLSNVLLLNAYDMLTHQTQFEIDARTLCLMAGYNSNDFDTLKASLTGLAETVAVWDMLDEAGQQEWGVSSLLSFATLKGGVCTYAYSPAMAQKLADPKVFALINMTIQRRFSSGYGLALYENCFRFHRIGTTGWWPLETFRKLMGVDGSAYYETYKHLNAKIIKPAVAEVNKYSNIIVTPEVRKRGRAVTDIRFLMKDNPQLAILDMDDGDGMRRAPIYAQLRGMGVSDRLARQWLGAHGEAAVADKLAYVNAKDGVQNPARYLAAALRDDYDGKAVDSKVGQGATQPPVRLAGRAARLGRVRDLAAGRSPTQRDADKRMFLNQIEDPAARADFERHGWMSALNAPEIFAFWEELQPDAFAGM